MNFAAKINKIIGLTKRQPEFFAQQAVVMFIEQISLKGTITNLLATSPRTTVRSACIRLAISMVTMW